MAVHTCAALSAHTDSGRLGSECRTAFGAVAVWTSSTGAAGP
jgi:hypothetical protein